MSRRRIKKKKLPSFVSLDTIRLAEALRPFANVILPGDEDYKGQPSEGADTIYLYIGKSDGYDSGNQGLLKLSDFRHARKALNT